MLCAAGNVSIELSRPILATITTMAVAHRVDCMNNQCIRVTRVFSVNA